MRCLGSIPSAMGDTCRDGVESVKRRYNGAISSVNAIPLGGNIASDYDNAVFVQKTAADMSIRSNVTGMQYTCTYAYVHSTHTQACKKKTIAKHVFAMPDECAILGTQEGE